jgi:hypothetical protein
VSPPSEQRSVFKVKGAKDLYRLRLVGVPPSKEMVPFAEWTESSFVHGHAAHGRFTCDNDKGDVIAARLIAFHDSSQLQHKEYETSYAVLPRAPFGVLAPLWMTLTRMLGHQGFNSMDGNLRRQSSNGKNLEELLVNGYIPLVQNACRYPIQQYPHVSRAAATWIGQDAEGSFQRRLSDGSFGAAERKKIVDAIDDADDRHVIHSVFYGEVALGQAIEINPAVERELSFGYFADGEPDEHLRAPRPEWPSMDYARAIITNTVPVLYGDLSGDSQAYSAYRLRKKLLERTNLEPSRCLSGRREPLKWRDEDKSTLRCEGDEDSTLPARVAWLEKQAKVRFGASRWVGLAASYRERTTPIAGSAMWSLLLRGQRLIFVWDTRKNHRLALAAIQDAGDLLVIPPGCEYAWYNIRSCISDQGHFYIPSLLASVKGEVGEVPGTMEILTYTKPERNHTNDGKTIIAYYVLVRYFLSNLASRPTELDEIAVDIVELLSAPVFNYLPIVQGRHFPARLLFATRVLAWTAPFATFALCRCIELTQDGIPVNPIRDSMTLEEAEDLDAPSTRGASPNLTATHKSPEEPAEGGSNEGNALPKQTEGQGLEEDDGRNMVPTPVSSLVPAISTGLVADGHTQVEQEDWDIALAAQTEVQLSTPE